MKAQFIFLCSFIGGSLALLAGGAVLYDHGEYVKAFCCTNAATAWGIIGLLTNKAINIWRARK